MRSRKRREASPSGRTALDVRKGAQLNLLLLQFRHNHMPSSLGSGSISEASLAWPKRDPISTLSLQSFICLDILKQSVQPDAVSVVIEVES
jgi:hypothetical protein